MQADIEMMQSNKPRNVRSHWKLRWGKEGHFPRAFPSEGISLSDTLISDFCPPALSESKFPFSPPFFKPPCLQYFVMAALGNWYMGREREGGQTNKNTNAFCFTWSLICLSWEGIHKLSWCNLDNNISTDHINGLFWNIFGFSNYSPIKMLEKLSAIYVYSSIYAIDNCANILTSIKHYN